MGLQQRRDTEKAAMKQRICAAAVAIIGREGYENLSIRKIAAAIEYSPTTIYLYYKDKAAIIADMAEGLYRRVAQNAALILENEAPAPFDERLRRILQSVILSLCQTPEMAKAIMYSGSNVIFGGAGGDAPSSAGLALLDDFLMQGVAEQILRPAAAGTAWMLMSALLGFVMGVVENGLYQREDFDHLADAFVAILVDGLRL